MLFALRLLPFLLLPTLGVAQESPININVGNDLLSSTRIFQMITLLTFLSLAPSLLMMVTSFTRIVVVFSFLRSAMGLQSSPPNTVLISLALFLTIFIMGPTFNVAYENGISPYLNKQIDEQTAFTETVAPFEKFMLRNVHNDDLTLFTNMLPAEERDEITLVENPDGTRSIENIPLRSLIPAFIISELRRAFEIGFLIFLPFIVIDLTIASILMSMGMMMLPPVMISLPFKIIFFVLVDGWRLLCGSLVESFHV
ncbi:MAG: flagellar type III secretion system pore protein FliP [Alphaproteobacteria bacterium]|nr:flagellar type III secretion system pore protein FliP [Alphaproteobacteria bacterium]MDD9919077.1 flagellar type III secretion system pore protein FliP [Alphaproteobacteria bacterium]